MNVNKDGILQAWDGSCELSFQKGAQYTHCHPQHIDPKDVAGKAKVAECTFYIFSQIAAGYYSENLNARLQKIGEEDALILVGESKALDREQNRPSIDHQAKKVAVSSQTPSFSQQNLYPKKPQTAPRVEPLKDYEPSEKDDSFQEDTFSTRQRYEIFDNREKSPAQTNYVILDDSPYPEKPTTPQRQLSCTPERASDEDRIEVPLASKKRKRHEGNEKEPSNNTKNDEVETSSPRKERKVICLKHSFHDPRRLTKAYSAFDSLTNTCTIHHPHGEYLGRVANTKTYKALDDGISRLSSCVQSQKIFLNEKPEFKEEIEGSIKYCQGVLKKFTDARECKLKNEEEAKQPAVQPQVFEVSNCQSAPPRLRSEGTTYSLDAPFEVADILQNLSATKPAVPQDVLNRKH